MPHTYLLPMAKFASSAPSFLISTKALSSAPLLKPKPKNLPQHLPLFTALSPVRSCWFCFLNILCLDCSYSISTFGSQFLSSLICITATASMVSHFTPVLFHRATRVNFYKVKMDPVNPVQGQPLALKYKTANKGSVMGKLCVILARMWYSVVWSNSRPENIF